jgi:hypothetical protein
VEKHIVQPDSPQIKTWRTRISCCIPKATDTHSECVILIRVDFSSGSTNAVQCLRYNTRGVPKKYSINLAPASARSGEYGGLLSISCLKSIMKSARFADVAAIQERVTTVLRSIPKEAFADSFQKLYERCQQCVVKDGDYFEDQ